MKSFTNKDVAEFLEEIAILLRLAGENDFKAIAFDRAARTIESLTSPIGIYVADNQVTSINGIGKSIAQDIYSLFETGEIPVLISLKKQVPPGLIRWLDISGLGPKNVYKIHNSLAITELEELKTACEDGRVAALPGLGAKSAEKILKSIAWMEQSAELCRLDES